MPLTVFFFLMIRRPPRSTLFPLHDALPIYARSEILIQAGVLQGDDRLAREHFQQLDLVAVEDLARQLLPDDEHRSEEHTSELQSRLHIVCRLLLEKKKSVAVQRFFLVNDAF